MKLLTILNETLNANLEGLLPEGITLERAVDTVRARELVSTQASDYVAFITNGAHDERLIWEGVANRPPRILFTIKLEETPSIESNTIAVFRGFTNGRLFGRLIEQLVQIKNAYEALAADLMEYSNENSKPDGCVSLRWLAGAQLLQATSCRGSLTKANIDDFSIPVDRNQAASLTQAAAGVRTYQAEKDWLWRQCSDVFRHRGYHYWEILPVKHDERLLGLVGLFYREKPPDRSPLIEGLLNCLCLRSGELIGKSILERNKLLVRQLKDELEQQPDPLEQPTNPLEQQTAPLEWPMLVKSLYVLDAHKASYYSSSDWQAEFTINGGATVAKKLLMQAAESPHLHYNAKHQSGDAPPSSLLLIPTTGRAGVLGVYAFQGIYAKLFNKEMVGLVEELIGYSCRLPDRRQLQQVARQMHRLALLQDPEILGNCIVETLGQLANADANLWFACRNDGKDNSHFVMVNSSLSLPETERKRICFDLPDSISGEALRHGHLVHKRDIWDKAPPYFSNLDIAKKYGWHSVLSAPLISADNLQLGVLNLYGKKKDQFGEWEEKIVSSFAIHAANTLQTHKEVLLLQKLAETGPKLIKRLGERHLLKEAVDQAGDIFSADSVVLYPYDPIYQCSYVSQRFIHGDFTTGQTTADQQVSPYGLGSLIDQEGTLVILDVEKGLIDRTPLKQKLSTNSEIQVRLKRCPSLKKNRVRTFVGICLRSSVKDVDLPRLGILYLNYQHLRKFNSEEIEAMGLFAQQIAYSMRHQRLLMEKERQTKQLETIQKMALKILEKEKLESLLLEFVEQANTLLEGSGGELYIPNWGADELELVVSTGVLRPKGTKVVRGQGLAGWVMEHKQPRTVVNYAQWEDCEEDMKTLEATVIDAPLMVGEELVGVVSVYKRYSKDYHRRYTEADQKILQELVSLAALALHQGKLRDQVSKNLKILKALNTTAINIMKEESEAQLIDAILQEVKELLALNFSGPDEHKGIGAAYLHCDRRRGVAINRYSQNPRFKGIEIYLTAGLIGEVMRTGEIQFKNNFNTWEGRDPIYKERGVEKYLKNVVEIPVKENDEIIGIIVVTASEDSERTFNQASRESLEYFADLVALALKNVRVLEEKKRQIRNLDMVAQVVQKSLKEERLPELLRAIAEEITERMELQDCSIMLQGYEQENPIGQTQLSDQQQLIEQYMDSLREGETKLLPSDQFETELALGPSAVLIAKISTGQESVGLISARKGAGAFFDESDKKLLNTLGAHVGLIIQRVSLKDRITEKQTRAASEIVSRVTSSDLQAVVTTILGWAKSLLHDAQMGIVAQKIGKAYRILDGGDIPATANSFFELKQNLAEKLTVSTEPQILNFTQMREAGLPLMAGIASAVLAPMLDGGMLTGLVLIGHRKKAFREEDKRFFQIIAELTLVTIQHFELRARLDVVQEINREVTSAISLKRSDFLKLLQDKLVHFFQARFLRISVFDGVHPNNLEGHVLVWNGQLIQGPKKQEKILVEQCPGLTDHLVLKKQALNPKDLGAAFQEHDPDYLGKIPASWLGAPMVIGQKVIGFIVLWDPQQHTKYSKGDLEHLEVIAAQAAVALTNAELYMRLEQQVQERTSALNQAEHLRLELADAYESLTSKQSQLMVAAKMASLGELVAGVAHEINNPLSFLKGAQYSVSKRNHKLLAMLEAHSSSIPTEELAKKEQLLEEVNEFQEIVDDGINRIEKIVTALKIISQPDRGEPVLVSISEYFERTLNLVKTNAKSGTVITLNLERLPKVMCKPSYLNQAFMNLVINAMDAIPQDREGQITITGSEDENSAFITVSDNGEGIAQQDIESIFQPFFTTKPPNKGTGLGLSITHNIVRDHGGKLTVESELGQGTSFCITLPKSKLQTA